MSAGGAPVGVVLGAAVIVISDILVVMLTDSCESTKETKASSGKISILDHTELRNLSVLSDVNGLKNYGESEA